MGGGGLLELYRRKLLLEKLTDDDLKAIIDSRDKALLQKIDRQTSTSSGVFQNVIGNVITDGAIFLLKSLLKR